MNAITNFRLCTLTDVELLQEIDRQTDKMFTEQKIPVRHIPAEPNKDYDLLIGELLIRNTEKTKALQEMVSFAEFHGYTSSAEINNAREVLKKSKT